jgi:TetR/AcrR family transcriptional regulator, copper-responsive repressor
LLHKDFSIPARRKANVIARLLREGVAAGELAENTDIDSMAWYYLGVLQAVLNLPQVGADLSILDRMIEVAMSAWPSTLSHS